MGIAIPEGMRSGFNFYAHIDEGLHAAGDNTSIWTSWTTDEAVANHFSSGPEGNLIGVILKKTFKKSEVKLNTSIEAMLMQEQEWLVPGIVTGAQTKTTTPQN